MTIKELYQENRKIKVHANRYWSSDNVRSMCIRHNFYTCGNNEEYNMMLHYVQRLPEGPTERNLYLVALDIWNHSDSEIQYNLDITDIMYYLESETVHVSFWEDDENE